MADDAEDDYDKACAIGCLIGLVRVGPFDALVLADEPATTAFLPDRGVFVRWMAAPSEEALLAGIDAALSTASWDEEVAWQVPGPVVLFDATQSGDECQEGSHSCVDLEAGLYVVRAAIVKPPHRSGSP